MHAWQPCDNMLFYTLINLSICLCHGESYFSELESNESHCQSTHKSKRKKASVLSNPAIQHLKHYMNTNFQPDFHRDGNKTIIY